MSKYSRWHDQIVDRARTRELDGYFERHHVRPTSLGGTNAKSNIVKLTFREHFIVHWILTKITAGNDQKKMLHAMSMMARRRQGRFVSSWQYDAARRAFCTAQSTFRHTDESKRKIGDANARRHYIWHHSDEIWKMLFVPVVKRAHGNKGRKFTEEHKRKIGAAQVGKVISEDTRRKISIVNCGRVHTAESKARMSAVKMGKRHTEEHRRRIGEANRGRAVSAETRMKIGAAHRGRKDTEITTRKRSDAQKGRRHSEETKAKMRLAAMTRERSADGVFL